MWVFTDCIGRNGVDMYELNSTGCVRRRWSYLVNEDPG